MQLFITFIFLSFKLLSLLLYLLLLILDHLNLSILSKPLLFIFLMSCAYCSQNLLINSAKLPVQFVVLETVKHFLKVILLDKSYGWERRFPWPATTWFTWATRCLSCKFAALRVGLGFWASYLLFGLRVIYGGWQFVLWNVLLNCVQFAIALITLLIVFKHLAWPRSFTFAKLSLPVSESDRWEFLGLSRARIRMAHSVMVASFSMRILPRHLWTWIVLHVNYLSRRQPIDGG